MVSSRRHVSIPEVFAVVAATGGAGRKCSVDWLHSAAPAMCLPALPSRLELTVPRGHMLSTTKVAALACASLVSCALKQLVHSSLGGSLLTLMLY